MVDSSMVGERFREFLKAKKSLAAAEVPEIVDRLLKDARAEGASDVHLNPLERGMEIRWRLDGVLQLVATLPDEIKPNVVARLKVVAGLLTYRTDVPQEGRIRDGSSEFETRVSTFPTLRGERAVARLFIGSSRFRTIEDLGLPSDVSDELSRAIDETSGMIVVSGPAGSGKTTTIYSCLRLLVARTAGGRSLTTIEDPIEGVVDGASQSQIQSSAGFDWKTALRSIVRQDPEVIVVGEIRDRETAEIAFQAALTGHLVLTTFHSGSAAGAVGRLLDMGIEPYVVRSGLLAVVGQRLARKLCAECSIEDDDPAHRLGLEVDRWKIAKGCAKCRGTGYAGRIMLAERLSPGRGEIGAAILEKRDVGAIEREAVAAGMITRWRRAVVAIESGLTSPAEIRRVLGVSASIDN